MAEDSAHIPPQHHEMTRAIDCGQIIRSVADQGIDIPNAEDLTDKMSQVVTDYEIDPSFFESQSGTLLLMAITDQLVATDQDKFADTMIRALVGKRSGVHDDSVLDGSNSISDEARDKTYEQFTNAELTNQMTEFLHSDPRFTELYKRLGADDETPGFKLRVLDIKADAPVYKLKPKREDYDQDTGYKEFKTDTDVSEAHIRRLEQHEDVLKSLLDMSATAPAWTSVDSDDPSKNMAFIPAPMAELILNGQAENPDIATIEHELTHTTQNLFIPGAKVIFGLGVEELRAEHFSGNTQGYMELKGVATLIDVYSGGTDNIPGLFEPYGESFDPDRFALDVARKFGLDGMLRLYTMVPYNYLSYEDPAHESLLISIDEHLGNIGSVSEFFRSRYIEAHGQEWIDKAVDKYVDDRREVAGPEHVKYVMDVIAMMAPNRCM